MTLHGIASLAGVVVVCGAAFIGGLYALIRRPWWLSNALGFALGAFPLAKLAGIGVPIVLALTAGIAMAALIHRPHHARLLPIEVAIIALVGICAFSVPANINGFLDLRLFLQWAAATSITVILLRLSRPRLHECGRWFVGGAVVGAAVGLVELVAHLPALVIRGFGMLGYKAAVFTGDQYAAGGGQTMSRLTGPFGHPNAAGVLLLIAALVAVVTYTGWVRATIVLFLLGACGLTLSRAIGLSVIVATLILIVFHSRGRTARLAVAGTLATGMVAAFALPAIRARILGSFTTADVGSSARLQALADYPQIMTEHWLFGVGWGRRQWWDPTTSYITNYVANAPLVTAYRAGVLAGVAFCVVLVFALVISYRGVRSGRWEAAILGAGCIGFVVAGAQLDHPIATATGGVTVFALLLAFVADLGRQLDESTASVASVAPTDDENAREEATDPAGHAR